MALLLWNNILAHDNELKYAIEEQSKVCLWLSTNVDCRLMYDIIHATMQWYLAITTSFWDNYRTTKM